MAPAPLYPEVLPVREAARGIVRELGFLSESYEGAGLTHSEAHALMEIGASTETTQSDLSRALRLDKSTTSRLVAALVERGWVKVGRDRDDGRKRVLSLTAAGRRRLGVVHGPANARVQAALASLAPADRATVLSGLSLYARALRATRLLEEIHIRPIEPRDNAPLADLITRALAEFGAGGRGFVTGDPEFRELYKAYQAPRSAYFVATREGRLVGGAGVAPLQNGPRTVCELQKMYLAPEARGHGLGQRLFDLSLSTARALGFRRCYLETLAKMTAARALYEKNGFRPTTRHGGTGHFGCNAFYERKL